MTPDARQTGNLKFSASFWGTEKFVLQISQFFSYKVWLYWNFSFIENRCPTNLYFLILLISSAWYKTIITQKSLFKVEHLTVLIQTEMEWVTEFCLVLFVMYNQPSTVSLQSDPTLTRTLKEDSTNVKSKKYKQKYKRNQSRIKISVSHLKKDTITI